MLSLSVSFKTPKLSLSNTRIVHVHGILQTSDMQYIEYINITECNYKYEQ